MTAREKTPELLLAHALEQLGAAEDLFALTLEFVANVTVNLHPAPPGHCYPARERRRFARRQALEALETIPLAMHALREGIRCCASAAGGLQVSVDAQRKRSLTASGGTGVRAAPATRV